MSIIAKYKYDHNIYADLVPVFNDGYSGYSITDEVETTNVVEGVAWEDGTINGIGENNTLEDTGCSRTVDYIPIKGGFTYVDTVGVNLIWYAITRVPIIKDRY